MPRACLVLLGVWLGLVVASWAMASASFRTVDSVLGPATNPELGRRLLPLLLKTGGWSSGTSPRS